MPSASSARLFVALELPAVVRDALRAWRGPLVREGSALRAVAPEALHATLCFLGQRPLADVAAIGAAVRACAAPARGLSLGEPLWLPRRRPNALALALDDGRGELGALQAAVAASLVVGGWLRAEQRHFLPHVTVARVRGGRNAADARALMRLDMPPVPGLAFDGSALTLYRSHLGGGGARYEPLARAVLG
ncbi:MAG TPA: RNA 2',3'-cyclic phosphodiesterase [Conexibacter sp.]|jgi:2'-5' RNA ligase